MLSTAKHDSNRTKKRRTRLDYGKNRLAASLGLEPRQRDPESLVLPLHHEANEVAEVKGEPTGLQPAGATLASPPLRINSLPSCAGSTAIVLPTCAICIRA